MLDDIFWVAAFPISFLLLGWVQKICSFRQFAIGSAVVAAISAAFVWLLHAFGFTVRDLFEVLLWVFGVLLLGAIVFMPLYEKYRNWRDDPIRLHRLSKKNGPD